MESFGIWRVFALMVVLGIVLIFVVAGLPHPVLTPPDPLPIPTI